jgi:N-acyl-D-amino-acid deacylase
MLDVLLQGGWVLDGLGTAPYRADVAVQGGRITAVGQLEGAAAERVLDCDGLCLSPGWVDIHGHADWTVLECPTGLNLLRQGCTLTVAGNCGGSPAPMQGNAGDLMRCGPTGEDATGRAMRALYPQDTWSMADLLAQVEAAQPGVNYVQLVGHNTLRRCTMGDDPRRATPDEIRQMRELLARSMEEGAYGLSSGLVFIPGCWSDTGELVELAREVGRRDGLYASHIRGERETNIEATQEFVAIAEQGRVRAQMSHMQSKYPAFGNGVAKVELLEQARRRGVDVASDSEAFPDNSATPAGFLQIYHLTPEDLVARLTSPRGRAEALRTMRSVGPWHPLGRFGPGGVPFRRAWDRVLVFDCPHDRALQGQSIASVAARRGVAAEEALFDLAVAEGGRGPRLIHDYIEDDHYRTLPWDHCIYPSVDTGLFDPATSLSPVDLRFWKETRYPGTLGLFPRVLGQFVRQEKLLTLEEAVRRMTSLAMQRLGIVDRGVLRRGMWADLVAFDRETIALRGEDLDPERVESFFPVGIRYVLVNGRLAVEGQRFTGVRAGQVLRKAG